MVYKYYVAYCTSRAYAAVIMTTDIKYDTENAVLGLSKYISETYCGGLDVVLLNVMRLKTDADKGNCGGAQCD